MKCWNYIFRRKVNGDRGMSIIKCCKQFSCILHLHLASRAFLFSVFCFLSSVYAFDVSVNASVSASQVYIGDLFTYQVEVTAPKGASVELPSFVGNLGSFEVRDWNTAETPAGNVSKTVWTATLNTFVSGDFALAPQQVVVVYDGDSVQTVTDPVPVRVSMRTTDADVDILEIEEPMEMPGTPWYVYVLIALGILLVAGLVYFAIKNWKRAEVVHVLPPYEEAVLALKNLKDGNLATKDQAAFFMDLGVIVRRYVERRFGTDILDATTAELKKRMAHVHGLPEAFKAGVVSLAEETEPVKFAKMKLGEDRVEHWMNFAEEMVEKTKPTEESSKTEDGRRKK